MKFDEEKALKADTGKIVSESGVYNVTIKSAVYKENNNGVRLVEFEFETDNGEAVNFVKIYVTKRDGSEHFQVNAIHSLMGILGIKDISVQNGNIPEFENKKVKVALQKEEYNKSNGEIGFAMKILHFFHPETGQTYSEWKNGKEAKTITRPISDIKVGTGGEKNNSSNKGDDLDDDLPF